VRFKVDENLPIEVAAMLRLAGHDAATVNEEGTCERLVAALSREPLAGRLWIVEAMRIRVRGGQ
jgi:uncharacterized protein with PIN domain